MGGPKRASMREGPLAALFRKTEEDAATTAAETASQEPAPAPAPTVPPAPDLSAPAAADLPAPDPGRPARRRRWGRT